MTYKVLSAFILGAMMATPTLAQTTTETPAPEATTTAPVVADPAAPAAGTIVVKAPDGYTVIDFGAVTADQLKGVDIYDPSDAKVAEIADVVIGAGDKVTGIVTDVGGFLGLGEHRISLSPDRIAIYKNADNDLRAYVSMTKDELKALPKYEGPK